MNLYAYVRADPVNLKDPTGTAETCTTQSFVMGIFEQQKNGTWKLIGIKPDSEFSVLDCHGTFWWTVKVLDPTLKLTDEQMDVIRTAVEEGHQSCGKGPRLMISPNLGLGLTGFLFFGGFSISGEAGISIPFTAVQGDFRGTQLYASGSHVSLVGLGLFVGAGTNTALGVTPGPLETGTSRSMVVAGGGAWKAGGELLLDPGPAPGLGGGGGPRAGYGAYLGGGVKHTATAATPELCY